MPQNEVKLKIRADDKTGRAFAKVKNRLASFKKAVFSVKGAIGAALGAAAFRGLAAGADELQKMNQRLGVSVEALSQYKHVADITGTSLDSITKGMTKLGKSVADAGRGLSTPRDALAELNLNADELIKMGLDDQFEIVADAIAKVEEPSKRVQLSMDLMGRSGVELLSTIQGTSKGMRELREEADELGVTLTQTEADAIANMNDAFSRFGNAVSGAATKLLALLAPALEWIANFLTDVFVGAVNVTKKVFNGFIDFVLASYRKIIEGLSFIVEQLSILPGEAGESMAKLSKAMDEYAADQVRAEDNTEDLIKKQKELNKAYGDTEDLLDKIGTGTGGSTSGKSTTDKVKDGIKDTKKEAESLEDVVSKGAEQIGDDLIESVLKGEDAWGSLKDTAKSVLKDINDTLLQQALNSFGFDSIGGLIKGGIGSIFGGGGGGGLGGLLSGAASLFSGFGGFFADGGRVGARKPIVVGERGPELFMPGSNGFIVPNHQMAMAGGGSPVVVNMQVNTPDTQSFKQSQNQIAADMARSIDRARRNL